MQTNLQSRFMVNVILQFKVQSLFLLGRVSAAAAAGLTFALVVLLISSFPVLFSQFKGCFQDLFGIFRVNPFEELDGQ